MQALNPKSASLPAVQETIAHPAAHACPCTHCRSHWRPALPLARLPPPHTPLRRSDSILAAVGRSHHKRRSRYPNRSLEAAPVKRASCSALNRTPPASVRHSSPRAHAVHAVAGRRGRETRRCVCEHGTLYPCASAAAPPASIGVGLTVGDCLKWTAPRGSSRARQHRRALSSIYPLMPFYRPAGSPHQRTSTLRRTSTGGRFSV